MSLGCFGAAVPRADSQAQSNIALDELRDRASAYVTEYERAFSTVVAEERYVQRVTGSGIQTETRQLRSDLILMNAGSPGWLIFRDVYEVDGRAVRDRDDRVLNLLLKPPPDAFAQTRRIAEESARFNIGPIQRTINTPTLALAFLRRELVGRSDFRIAGRETIRNVSTVELRFEEREMPRVVNTRDDAAARGRFWIDPQTGRILKTQLELDSAGMSASIVVSYAPQPTLKLWVPEMMIERYRTQTSTGTITARDLRDGAGFGTTTVTVEGTASYGKYRQFSVDVSTIIR